MTTNLYPLKQFFPTLFDLLKNQIPGIKKIFSLITALLFFATITNAQGGACPNSNCESGDMVITKVELVDAITEGPLPSVCQPGQGSISVKLKVTFTATAATRYGFLIIGDLSVDGGPTSRVWQCYPDDFLKGTHTRILDQVINWPCGSTITLSNVYTAWQHQAPSSTICSYLNSDGTISNCSAIDPKCKFYAGQSFVVAAPLVANFIYSGSCPGNTLYQPITFSSPATGTGSTTGGNKPYQYSWEIKDAVTNVVLATSTNNPYSYTPTTNHNLTVKLTVTDASEQQQSDEETKTVTVVSCCTPPTVNASPSNQTKCEGTAASFTVTHSGGTPAPAIQWQVSSNSGVSFSNLTNGAPYSNVTTATLNISSVTNAMNGYQYKAVLKSGMCESVETSAATLTVNATSVGGTVAAAQTICFGTLPLSDLVLSGKTGDVVKWQRSTDNFALNSSDIVNTTTTLTAAAIGALTQDTWFRAVVKNGECTSANSNTIKITVDPTSNGGSVSAAQTICFGSQPNSNLTLSGHIGTVVKWQKATSSDFTSGLADIANITTTLTAASIGVLTQDTWFRAIVKSGMCNEAISNPVKITVNPTSVGGTVASPQTICSGNQPTNSISLSGQTGSVVKWQKSTSSNFAGASDILVTSTTLSAANMGVLTADTWFRAIVKSGVCTETNSASVKITVQQPIGNNTVTAPQTICSGTTPNGLTGSTPTGGDGNFTYQWQWRTGNSWSNIQSANGKDYAPGVISQTTEFRRIVTAGSACSNSSSAGVLISISPESQVFAIAGSNFCESAPNTGTVKLMSSYPGVSYQLKKEAGAVDEDIQDPKIGTGAALIWTDLSAGSYYVYGTGIAPTFCTSTTATVNVLVFDCSVFYTLTQGYYGNKNGKSCIGNNPVNTIKYLLGDVDLVVGSINSVTIPATMDGALKINQALPGGSTPDSLPTGNCIITTGCFTYPAYLTKQGKINNNLLSQTITLSLNVRWNNGELLLFPIRSGWLTTQKMKGCFPNAVLVEVCENGTISSILMNQNVVNYLGATGTVADLLLLANEVLGGSKKPGIDGVPSYAEINAAVDAINKSFDEGRRFLNYFDEKQTCEMLFPQPVLLAGVTTTSTITSETKTSVTVTAFPNPFTDNVNFVINSKLSGQASLEVYDMMGQKIKTVYQGHIMAGPQKIILRLQADQLTNLFYVFKVGNERVTGKLLHTGIR